MDFYELNREYRASPEGQAKIAEKEKEAAEALAQSLACCQHMVELDPDRGGEQCELPPGHSGRHSFSKIVYAGPETSGGCSHKTRIVVTWECIWPLEGPYDSLESVPDPNGLWVMNEKTNLLARAGDART